MIFLHYFIDISNVLYPLSTFNFLQSELQYQPVTCKMLFTISLCSYLVLVVYLIVVRDRVGKAIQNKIIYKYIIEL